MTKNNNKFQTSKTTRTKTKDIGRHPVPLGSAGGMEYGSTDTLYNTDRTTPIVRSVRSCLGKTNHSNGTKSGAFQTTERDSEWERRNYIYILYYGSIGNSKQTYNNNNQQTTRLHTMSFSDFTGTPSATTSARTTTTSTAASSTASSSNTHTMMGVADTTTSNRVFTTISDALLQYQVRLIILVVVVEVVMDLSIHIRHWSTQQPSMIVY